MGYEKGVNLDLNDKSLVEIFYKKTSYRLLSYPYKTNCVHYPNQGFDSQFDCKSQSMNKYFTDRFDGIPGIYFGDNKVKEKFSKNWNEISQNKSLFSEMNKYCEGYCQENDCIREYFNT
jgi:hypothetical protein